MSNGRNKNKKQRQGRTSRPARGHVVRVGPRPKMPLIIAGVFVAGVLFLLLASLFSPKNRSPQPAPAPTNVSAAVTNAPAQ